MATTQATKKGTGKKRSAAKKAAAKATVASPVPVQIVPNRRAPAPVPVAAPRGLTREQREAKEARELHRASFQGQVEAQFDAHRNTVRGVVIVGVAVGAVKLNQKFPEGLTPLKLEASTCLALSTTAGALISRHFGFKRAASAMLDITLGGVTGTLAADVQQGKTPLIAQS